MHNSSGKSIYKRTSISKIGNSTLRKALYFPATLRSVDDNSYILNDDIGDYIRERGGFSYAEPFPRYNKNNDDKE